MKRASGGAETEREIRFTRPIAALREAQENC